MKHLLQFSVFVLFYFSIIHSNAQIILSENFNNGIPSSFTLIDNDGLTPNSAVAYINNAWVARAVMQGSSDSVAMSTSWYNPVGTADDWLITPQLSLGAASTISWRALAVDGDFPDGYQVLVSTTGTAVADFQDTVLTINEENSTWTSRTLNLDALGFSNTNVYIAFRNNSQDKFLLAIDDIVVKNLTPIDVQIYFVQVPDISCDLTNAEDITVSLTNAGTTAVSNVPLSYTINGATPVTENFTGTLQPTESALFTFSQKADFSAKNTLFNVVAYSEISGDGDLSNDTSLTEVTVNVATVDVLANPYSTSFETFNEVAGWKAEDTNADENTWDVFSGQTNIGDFSFLYLYDENNAADDWLFSTCLDLVANHAYRLDFYHKTGSSATDTFPEKFLVSYGLAPNSLAMSNQLKDFGEVINSEFEQNALGFTVPSDNTYYLGFKVYSDADMFYLSIDDVTVSELLPPTASFTYNTNELDAAFSSPNGTDPVNELTWDFGDGSATETGAGVLHSYTTEGTYYVCLTVTNAAGSDTFCDSVTVELQSTGIANILANNLKLYPNPSTGKVNVNLPGPGEVSFEIINTIGVTVFAETKIGNSQYQLDLSSLNNGVYIITTKQYGMITQNKITIAR